MLQRSHILEGMKINVDNFDFVCVEGEKLYKSFVPIKCPYFSDFVYFNAEGLAHLKFKGRHNERLIQDQYMRFKLLHLAPHVLKLSRTLQGMSVRNGFESVRCNGVTKLVAVNRKYFEFIAIIDDLRARIIVKQINDGQLQFWSIIPYWGGGFGRERIFYYGNPDED